MAVVNQKDLESDIRLYLRTFAYTYCKKASEDITRMAKFAIDQFYGDYSPEYYVRTNNLRNNSYSKYFHDNGNTMYGGVKISSENMFDNYEVSPDYIANAGWYGWHGLMPHESVYYSYKTRAPLDIVKRQMNNKHFLNSLESIASKDAVSQNYKVLKVK